MTLVASPRAAGVCEARAYLECARLCCQDATKARFLDLVVARSEKKISEADWPNLLQVEQGDETMCASLRTVLVDIDGTPLDSNDAHACAWMAALKSHHHHVRSTESVR